MHTQECDIELLDQLWVGFYDVISVCLEDGTELPIWAAHGDTHPGELNADAQLLIVSKQPITKRRALEVQEKLRDRSEIGWYFDIRQV